MIIALNILIFAAVIFLQTSLLARFDIFGFMPNFALILMISFAFFRKTYEAYIFAFISGLILDILSGGPFGLHIASFMLMVFVSGFIVDEDHTRLSNVFVSSFAFVMAFLFYGALLLYIDFSLKDFSLSGVLFSLGQVFVTFVFFILIFPWLKRLFLWEDKKDKER
ncbi:rod shape-determining protein MreD [candidate division WS5 bacterium]|uniref:Rod shape-determining protein MreD n=1 Tax=candidate division WS5 bacterium TaxID=2093353 RepID=A0A419DEE6_9BACT|nr:MAG: rod shape-determining protein MreD [candidate division WS5 bacterium]